MMRKKGSNEDERRREREESMNRKAAALAWLKHGRKGSTVVLGNGGRGGNVSKMQNPLLYAPRARRHQGNGASASDGNGAISNEEESITTMSVGAILVPPSIETPYHHTLNSLQQTSLSSYQASRFKAEALALQNSSSSATTSAITTSSNKQHLINMTTGQSLALLSLLPHHQSQKCFKSVYPGTPVPGPPTTPWDCGSSLYDSFELLCLSNQLGRCLTTVNAAAAAAASASSGSNSSCSSSSYSKLMKNLASNPLQGPSLQPSYIPRSLYSLPQFMIPNYLATKSSKKRSSLIHPIFSSPIATTSTPSPCLPAPPLSANSPLHTQSANSQSVADDHATRKKAEGGGFRRVFNSLLKSLHMKEDPAQQKPKRSNLSEELEKLPKNRPASSRGVLKYEDPAAAMALSGSPKSYSSNSGAEMESKRSPGSAAAMETRRSFGSSRSSSSSSYSSAASAASMSARRASTAVASAYQFRNEGFRTTSKPPKSVKWVPSSS